MTPEQQRIVIAEARGWRKDYIQGNGVDDEVWVDPQNKKAYSCDRLPFPDYLNDLNAMHEAEKVLTDTVKREYIKQLVAVVNESEWSKWPTAHATAAQRAEAFLRTLNLWTP